MNIDHSKLIELLAEAADITEQNAEEKLNKLVEEINEAFEEGDAYEVNGLGVFSKMGNNVIFIPADDFATEINYKYVGMEPIELDEPSQESEAPAAAEEISPQQDDGQDEEDEDPFGGLLDDPDTTEEQPDEPEEVLQDKEPEDISDFADEEAEEAPFDITDEEPTEEAEEELTEPADEEKPGPEAWGIDTYKDDSAESMFSGLLGDKPDDEAFSLDDDDDSKQQEESLEEELEDALSDVEKEDTPEDDALSVFFSDDITDKAAADEEEQEEPEDPFEALAGELDDDEDDELFEESEKDDETETAETETSESADKKADEVVPVIKNLASEGAKQKRKEEVQKKEEKSDKKEKPTPSFKRTATPRETKRQPVLLWVLLLIVVLAGGTYGLGYFGVINIPGVTPKPQMAATQSPTEAEMPPAQPETQPEKTEPPVSEEPAQEEPESTESTEGEPPSAPQAADDENRQEQATSPEVSNTEASAQDQPKYGLTGAVNRSANDGYTIVVFSLSNKENAEAKIKELTAEGYRALLASIPSAQYGQLWRVSVGQFESTRTATLAANTLKAPYANNYFITRIY